MVNSCVISAARAHGHSPGLGCLAVLYLIIACTGCGRLLYDPLGTGDNADVDARGPGGDAQLSDGDLPATCPDGSVKNLATGRCYTLVVQPDTWEGAEVACTAFGDDGHLVTVSDLSENAFTTTLSGGPLSPLWLGASDAAVEGTWVWVTGEAVPFDNWRMGEPNNRGPDGQDCLALEVSNGGTWDDRSCESPYGYVCEHSP